MESRGKGQKKSLGNEEEEEEEEEEEKTCEDCEGKAKVRDRKTLCSPGGRRDKDTHCGIFVLHDP